MPRTRRAMCARPQIRARPVERVRSDGGTQVGLDDPPKFARRSLIQRGDERRADDEIERWSEVHRRVLHDIGSRGGRAHHCSRLRPGVLSAERRDRTRIPGQRRATQSNLGLQPPDISAQLRIRAALEQRRKLLGTSRRFRCPLDHRPSARVDEGRENAGMLVPVVLVGRTRRDAMVPMPMLRQERSLRETSIGVFRRAPPCRGCAYRNPARWVRPCLQSKRARSLVRTLTHSATLDGEGFTRSAPRRSARRATWSLAHLLAPRSAEITRIIVRLACRRRRRDLGRCRVFLPRGCGTLDCPGLALALDDERKRHSGPTHRTGCIGRTSRSAGSPSVGAQAPSLSQRRNAVVDRSRSAATLETTGREGVTEGAGGFDFAFYDTRGEP